jgi:hypothetical protein
MYASLRLVARWFVAAGVAAWVCASTAQVPPHQPGSICFTPSFWCWADPPGPPGGQCWCPTRNGPVRGWLG